MVFQKPNPFPKVFDNIAYGPIIHGAAENKDQMDNIVETSLKKAALWDEVKDRLNEPGTSCQGGNNKDFVLLETIG